MHDAKAHDLGRQATFIDVVEPGLAVVSTSMHSHLYLAVSSAFKHILHSSLAGALTQYISRTPTGSGMPASTVAK